MTDARTSYRSRSPENNSGSDLDSDAEEDSPLWKQKQQKYFRKTKGSEMAVCSSPTLPEVRREASNEKKRKNNVWGSVLQEQDLTQTLAKSGGVESKEGIDFETRDVESYDFRKKYDDPRPDPEDDDQADDDNDESSTRVQSQPSIPANKPNTVRSIIGYEDTLDNSQTNQQRGRKRKAVDERPQKTGGVFDRLGPKKLTTTKLGEIEIHEDMEAEEIVKKIAEFLHEPKVELIERVVAEMGKGVAIRVLKATKDVEEGGGMYTMDGSRRRTPGGVYIQLLKQQPEFTSDVKKAVFKEDIEEKARERKEARKKNRKQRNQRKQLQKENKEDQSRSRSNSVSRSRSPKNKGSHSGEEEMEAGQETNEQAQTMCHDNGNHSNRKHRSRNSRRRHRYNDYDRQVDDDRSEGSDDGSERGHRSSERSKPLTFEEELAAAKKQIERSKSQEQGTMEGDNVDKDVKDMNEAEMSDVKETSSEMIDLDAEEGNVVDVLLDGE